MKKITAYVFLIFMVSVSHAQNVVTWNYTAKKIAERTYEVHLTATIQLPWHIYSQTTPAGGPLKTSIAFNKNPMIILEGKMKEEGELKQRHEEVFGVDVRFYANNVDFVQVIKLKSKTRTRIFGTVEYMACNDQQCLPPKKQKFSVEIE
jgi:hypothetical protein